VIEICKASTGTPAVTGTFSFTVSGLSGTFLAPVGGCTGPITVPSGNVTVTEAATAGATLVGVATVPTSALVSQNLGARSAVVAVTAGGVASQVRVTFTNQAVVGTVKICKIAGSDNLLNGVFNFNVTGVSATVGVLAGPASQGGFCTVVGNFPVGTQLTVTEQAVLGVNVSAIAVAPGSQLVGSANLSARAVTIVVGAGTTEVTFTNVAVPPGVLKVCKIAGDASLLNAVFNFTVNGTPVEAIAGPASQGGFCTVVGSFAVNTQVTITEQAVDGVAVSAIVVAPSDRIVGTANLSARTVTAVIGTGTTDVSFTNRVVPPPGPECKPGNGFGDKNHCHTGPPGQLKKGIAPQKEPPGQAKKS
jgi:hypothetical protein